MDPDYVVVGAGSAGCVLAARLTEDRRTRVLLLEAGGPDRGLGFRAPAAFSRLLRTDADWNFSTEPQPALAGRKLYWPRGKALGGSSSINAMIYIRGHRADYDAWGPGWTYDEVLPYFRKSERYHGGGEGSKFHGANGPLHVERLRYRSALGEAFVDAAVELGFARNDDFNGLVQEGVGFYDVTQSRGRRDSTATAFLRPALGRPGLTVATRAHATRIVVEKGRAVGVEYAVDGKLRVARAAREVVLAAGAIGSPHLLMLSGIGAADALARAGVAVVADVPGVGRELSDHLAIAVSYRSPKGLDKLGTPIDLARWLAAGGGPLSSNIAECGGFVRVRDERPDLQFHVAPLFFLDHGFTKPEGLGFTIGPTILRPKSRGSIELASKNPFAAPRIEPRYCSEPADLELLVEGVKLAQRIAAGRALAPLLAGPYLPKDAGDLAAHVRAHVQTLYHPVGTCAMGSVVDASLRVRGVEGLRVIDASVMPRITSGNTNAPTIMIAERGADLLLEQR
jgi:choline dehydrogenase